MIGARERRLQLGVKSDVRRTLAAERAREARSHLGTVALGSQDADSARELAQELLHATADPGKQRLRGLTGSSRRDPIQQRR
jgi:hypothetical protein